jgi:hypothetical protein
MRQAIDIDPAKAVHDAEVTCFRQEAATIEEAPQREQRVHAAGLDAAVQAPVDAGPHLAQDGRAGFEVQPGVVVARAAAELGLPVRGFASSDLPGPKGNRETFVWCGGEGPGVDDLESAAREVEP